MQCVCVWRMFLYRYVYISENIYACVLKGAGYKVLAVADDAGKRNLVKFKSLVPRFSSALSTLYNALLTEDVMKFPHKSLK